jgi:acyl transferase domain-containing protein/acyl carrier protein
MQNINGLEVAIIGISIRVPGAKNQHEFWENLIKGKESISNFSKQELLDYGIEEEIVENMQYIRHKGVLEDIEYFDAPFFKYTPRVASLMDPQIRQLHECCWEALEDAACILGNYKGLIGIYVGAGANFHWIARNMNNLNNPSQIFEADNVNNRDYLSTNIAYKLGLNGPACTIQTACSTSLTAVHIACQGLLGGDCDLALAGGVSITYPKKSGYLYQEGMIHSPDGHCRTFDIKANGTVAGDGIGLIVLKRLEDAIKDKDYIYAVIKGSAINNDGNRKVDFTAPSVKGQYEVIQSALRLSGVHPETISYIEAHGTGTNIGDSIEIEALIRAFNTNKKRYCAIGSVKSNIGHLINAAGIVGLIKTVLSIKHKTIPPSLHFENSNEKIDFENSPFYVPTLSQKWDSELCRAGVSSFGIGGTNAHVILEEAPVRDVWEQLATDKKPLIFPFSAKTQSALKTNIEKIGNFLKGKKESLNDIAFTLSDCRQRFHYQSIAIAENIDQLIDILEYPLDSLQAIEIPKVAFMFTGQGTQYLNMGMGLYESNVYFRNTMDYCNQVAININGINYLNELFSTKQSTATIQKTIYAQPCLFMIEYALGSLLINIGIRPEALVGHSLGEYSAACLANVFSFEDALRIVIKREELIEKTKHGKMISVFAPLRDIKKILTKDISIASVNCYNQVVISGEKEKIDSVKKELDEQSIKYIELKTSRAFHSVLMEDIIQEFYSFLMQFSFKYPEIPLLSNYTGDLIQHGEFTPDYWVKHLCNTVLFEQNIQTLKNFGCNIFVEVGPGKVLSNLSKVILDDDHIYILSSLVEKEKNRNEYFNFLNMIGNLWMLGVDVNWKIINGIGNKISLPTYSFDKIRYWNDKTMNRVNYLSNIVDAKLERHSSDDISKWFYHQVWQEKVKDIEINDNKQYLLILNDDNLPAIEFEKMLLMYQDSAVLKSFSKDNINTSDLLKYKTCDIIHCLSYGDITYNEFYEKCYLQTLSLIQNLSQHFHSIKFNIYFITNNCFDIYNTEKIDIKKSLLIGLIKVIPVEYENIRCKLIDSSESFIGDGIYNEIFTNDFSDSLIMYRGKKRFVSTYSELNVSLTKDSDIIKENGNYLIIGGTGGLGLESAIELSQHKKINLFLIGRRELPNEEEMDYISAENEYLELYDFANKVKAIKHNRSLIKFLKCDATNYSELKTVIESIENRFGKLNGVIVAAGIADGRLIQAQTKEKISKVFASKIEIVNHMQSILNNSSLDFIFYYSSLLSIIGNPGQVAYSSANSYLNATAQKNSTSGKKIVSICWDGWDETGMASGKQIKSFKEFALVNDHPLFSEKFIINDDKWIFTSILNEASTWELHEHKLNNKGLFPGTAFVEQIRYATQQYLGKKELIIEEIVFLSPFYVEENKTKKVYIELNQKLNVVEVSIYSIGKDNKIEHVKAIVRLFVGEKREVVDLSFLKEYRKTEFIPWNKKNKVNTIIYGERWNNIRKIAVHDSSGYAELNLCDSYMNDLEHYYIHPGLCDTATSFMISSNNKYQGYLPFSYKNLKIYNPIPKFCISHAHLLSKSEKEISFRIELINNKGEIIFEVDQFTLIAVSPESLLVKNGQNSLESIVLGEKTKKGISNEQGRRILGTILNGSVPPCVIISTTKLNDRFSWKNNHSNLSNSYGSILSSDTIIKLERPSLKTEFVKPENGTEKNISKIWSDILGINRIGTNDNFFELGGDSIKAISIISKISSIYNTKIQVSEIFNNPTIKEFSTVLLSKDNERIKNIQNITHEDNLYPATSAQKRIFVLEKFGNTRTTYNTPLVYTVKGKLNLDRLKYSFEQLIKRHSILRTSFEQRENDVFQKVHNNYNAPLEYIQSQNVNNINDLIRPFTLDRHPLIRLVLFENPDKTLTLLLDIHHIIADGTTVSIFIDEILKLYEGIELPPINLEYKDYSVWVNNISKTNEYSKHKEFWISHFANPFQKLEIPADNPFPKEKTYNGDLYIHHLTDIETQKINSFIANKEVSLYTFSLSIFSILMYKITQLTEIIVGNVSSGRNHPDVQDMAGMFAYTCPVKILINPDDKLEQLMHQVMSFMTDVMNHQGYQYEDLINDLNLPKSLMNDPLFSIVFNVQNFEKRIASIETSIDNGKIVFKREAFHSGTTKFDIVFFLYPENENISIEIEYNRDKYQKDTIASLVSEYASLLVEAIDNHENKLNSFLMEETNLNDINFDF